MRLTRRHPWLTTKGLFTGNSLLPVGTPELARESFFSPQTPESDVVRYAARLNGESQRVARHDVDAAQTEAGDHAVACFRRGTRPLHSSKGSARSGARLSHRRRDLPRHGPRHDA